MEIPIKFYLNGQIYQILTSLQLAFGAPLVDATSVDLIMAYLWCAVG